MSTKPIRKIEAGPPVGRNAEEFALGGDVNYLVDKTAGPRSLFEWIPSNYHAGIEIGTSSVDVGGWIQDAADAVVTAGRGTLVAPGGLYRVDRMIDLTRAPEIDLAIVGRNAMFSCTAATQIEAIFKTARTGSQAPYRYHTKFNGIRIRGNSLAFTGIKAAMDEGSDIVSITDCYVEGCTIGVDLEAVMESHVADLTLFSNTLGLRIRPDALQGGGNANDFHGVKITGGHVGILLYPPNDAFPFHNNVFTGTLIQGLGVAGIVIAGSLNYNQTFIGGHVENGLDPTTTGTVQVGDFGAERTITIPKGDVVLLSAEAKFIALSPDSIAAKAHSAVEGTRSSKLPRYSHDGGSIGGNSGTVDATLDVFDARDVVLDAVRIVARHGSPKCREFYRSAVIIEEVPGQVQGGLNQVAAHLEVHAPATSTNETDPALGDVVVVDFDASSGHGTLNSYRRSFADVTPSGWFVYSALAMKATTDTSITLGVTGDAGIYFVPVPLRAGKWTYVRTVSNRTTAALQEWMVAYPTGTDGPTVRFARPYAANVPEPVDAAAAFNGSAVV